MVNLNKTESNMELIKTDQPSEASTMSKDSCALHTEESQSDN